MHHSHRRLNFCLSLSLLSSVYAHTHTQLPFHSLKLKNRFRKPHLSFRFPAPILDLLPQLAEIDVAAHPTLDSSQPSIAHHDATPQATPFVAVDRKVAQQYVTPVCMCDYFVCVCVMKIIYICYMYIFCTRALV